MLCQMNGRNRNLSWRRVLALSSGEPKLRTCRLLGEQAAVGELQRLYLHVRLGLQRRRNRPFGGGRGRC